MNLIRHGLKSTQLEVNQSQLDLTLFDSTST